MSEKIGPVGGDTVQGGECVFARRIQATEDDGWLLCFTFNDPRCRSELHIVNAKSMKRVARVAMPARVCTSRLSCVVGEPIVNAFVINRVHFLAIDMYHFQCSV